MSFKLFLRSMRERRDWHGSRAKRAIYAIKYAARCVIHGRAQAAWLRFIYATPGMAAVHARDRYLFDRPMHRYINSRMRVAARYRTILDHHRFVQTHLPASLIASMYRDGAVVLGDIQLKDGSILLIKLAVPAGRGREGELCLQLANTQHQVLSSLIFTIGDNGGSLLIGCLQGACAELGRESVRTLTRQCHGLRPKNLLLSMLLAFAEDRGIARVRGVSQQAHPFAATRGKIKADYDSFWQECEGRKHRDGFYDLPAREPVRDETQVESKHRSAFRKREALRWEACHLFVQATQGHVGDALREAA